MANKEETKEQSNELKLYEIFPYLYLSAWNATTEYDNMKSIEITNIINVSDTSQPMSKQLELFDVMYCPFKDNEDVNILTQIETLSFYINKLQTNDSNKKIVVNCHAGKSRSVAVIIGYCMIYKNMKMKDAYDHIINIKSDIEPNLGFLNTLMDIDRKLFNLDESSFKTYYRSAQINELQKYYHIKKSKEEINEALKKFDGDHKKAAESLK